MSNKGSQPNRPREPEDIQGDDSPSRFETFARGVSAYKMGGFGEGSDASGTPFIPRASKAVVAEDRWIKGFLGMDSLGSGSQAIGEILCQEDPSGVWTPRYVGAKGEFFAVRELTEGGYRLIRADLVVRVRLSGVKG